MSDAPVPSARPSGQFRLLEGGGDGPASSRPIPLVGRPARPPSIQPLLRIAARRKKALVFIDVGEVWAFEADARLTFVHSAHGKLDIDVSLAEIEASPLGHLFLRVHRSWLANLALVKALDHVPGETQLFVGSRLDGAGRTGIRVPVSRDRVRIVRDSLLASAIGVRRRESADDADETRDELAPESR